MGAACSTVSRPPPHTTALSFRSVLSLFPRPPCAQYLEDPPEPDQVTSPPRPSLSVQPSSEFLDASEGFEQSLSPFSPFLSAFFSLHHRPPQPSPIAHREVDLSSFHVKRTFVEPAPQPVEHADSRVLQQQVEALGRLRSLSTEQSDACGAVNRSAPDPSPLHLTPAAVRVQ